MSSSSGFLAYALNGQESAEVIDLRKRHAERHLQRLHRDVLVRTEVGDGESGFVGWSQDASRVSWRPYIRREDVGVAWLHIPSVAGGPDSGVDEWELAHAVIDGRVSAGEIGSPFAVARWQNGQLDIVNDMFGLVRLFHFNFDGGDVWTTRPGLAHVFMGEQPKKNLLAWSGMATIGWAPSGVTHLGDGKQVAGGSHIRSHFRGDQRLLEVDNNFGKWLEASREAEVPSPEASVRDMELSMATARRWPQQAMADLSGGKDSRVVAAIGIRSSAIKSVRTIATDHGEVETAQECMSLIDTDVEHLILDRKDPSVPGGSFLERVGSKHRAWEGRYLARTAYNSAEFTGFGVSTAPSFNGLGGEVMAGGNLLDAWHDRLINAPGAAARDKLAAMTKSGLGTSAEAKERVLSDIQGYVAKASDFGIKSAAGVMDLFYDLDRMPNWSITYCTPNVLTPLFAPSLLTFAAQRVGSPMDNGEAHLRLLREAIPRWAEVPFYKPTGKKRAMPFIWENGDWAEIRAFVREHIDRTASYDSDATPAILDSIDAGEGTKREEVFIHRYIWESTFDIYLDDLATEALATAEAISSTRRTAREYAHRVRS